MLNTPDDCTLPVLGGQGTVELADFMGDDNTPADAARVSFRRTAEDFDDEANEKLTRYLAKHDHGTPFEMVVYKFRLVAPIVVWWQLVRHRVASLNLSSGRYTPYERADCYLPETLRLQSTENKQGSEGELAPDKAAFLIRRMIDLYDDAFTLYRDMVERDGVAREQARLVLPAFACQHAGIWQINARSLKNFLALRRHFHAQSEIREYAEAAATLVERATPNLYRLFLCPSD